MSAGNAASHASAASLRSLSHVTWKVLRTASGRTPSRFLLEIPEDLFDVRDIGEAARPKVPAATVQSFFGNLESLLDD